MQGNTVPIKDGCESIIEAFENPSWIGQLRERWKKIKKLTKAQRLGLV